MEKKHLNPHTNSARAISPAYQEKLDRLRPIDDDFMRCLFRENLPLARQVLPILTGDESINISHVETQMDMRIPGARSVELDVYCTSDDGWRYNLETERRAERGKPKRARYHASVLDIRNLQPRQDFEELPETVTIFLMETDTLGEGLPRYHADRYIKETGKDFGDKTHILYLNAQYRDNTAFGNLMADFMEKDPEKMHTEELKKACFQFKRTEEGIRQMCQVFDEIRAEGKAEGRAEGRENALVGSIRSLMENMKMTAQQAMEVLGIAPEERGKLMSML